MTTDTMIACPCCHETAVNGTPGGYKYGVCRGCAAVVIGVQYPYVSVSGGKFHRVAADPAKAQPWRTPLPMKCGRSLVPQNYFASREDAIRYTGGRTTHLCKQCESA